ncbi:MAG TPA: helix-turn-helix domain-containing protein [Dehalococcoidia bacterium]|jgi:excisionase family DNA binding protein|nr:helix-turn-helix domain-containing protein [Dehalococcoidia bacterium]
MTEDRLLKVNEVAERLRINPATVRAWLKSGRLRGVYMGSDKVGWRIPESEVRRITAPDFAADGAR